ncbi:MAG: fumarylacetoacetate hydrolase family protein [Psychrobacillus psychrodurans]
MSSASIKLCHLNELKTVEVDPLSNSFYLNGQKNKLKDHSVASPVCGTIYGTILNYQEDFTAMEEQLNQNPYAAPPKAPILYIKPANTINYHGAPITIPKEVSTLEVGASLGVVIGKKATAIKEEDAFSYIAGYTIVNDVSIAHESIFRPAVPYKARDGFCSIGPWIIDAKSIMDSNSFTIKVFINDELHLEKNTSTLVRPIARLLKEITEFMTLDVGDLLLVGIPLAPPKVKVGDQVRVDISEIGSLENYMVDEEEGCLP